MSDEAQITVVELLQQLGLKEYEAKVFAALARSSNSTAREISELADVPRTRVYDAGEQLASRGLVEVRHSNPKRYRAIPIGDAVEILRSRYDARFEQLATALTELETNSESASDSTDGVWSLSGVTTIAEITEQMVEDAQREVLAVLGSTADQQELLDALGAASDRGVTVYLGLLTDDEDERDRAFSAVPDAKTPPLLEDWLNDSESTDDKRISQLIVADREQLLLSAVREQNGDTVQNAIHSKGFGNGLLVVVRRLLENGLPE
ncbi:TrmB family transcriptional regulator [Halorussus halophilus]|uniref:TrmB family transcriptional regulator n=1 Tax=Halorussus halophilus TaxID=2650975 RepID=UPI0013010F3F|nr:TrmB family transcriptional regulator [Halorussus halophilus]